MHAHTYTHIYIVYVFIQRVLIFACIFLGFISENKADNASDKANANGTSLSLRCFKLKYYKYLKIK